MKQGRQPRTGIEMTINLPFLCSNAIDSITDIYYDSLYRVIVTLNIFREEKKTNFHQEKLCWFIVVANLKVLERESGHKTLSKKFHHPHRLTPESESRGIKTFWSCFVSLRWNITGQSSHNLDFLDLRPDLWTLGLWGPCHLIIFLTLWCCYSTIHYCTFYEQPWKQNANSQYPSSWPRRKKNFFIYFHFWFGQYLIITAH